MTREVLEVLGWTAGMMLLFACKAPAGGDVPAEPGATDSASPPPRLADCVGGVLAQLTRERMSMPGADSEGYAVADSARTGSLESALSALFDGLVEQASDDADTAGYRLCAGVTAEAGLVLLEPRSPGTGEARLVWRQQPTRGLILGAPHPWFDTDTLEESVALFEQVGARVLIVSGTHRCANEAASGCDGTTSVCGESAPYRESDMAHVAQSVFQSFHQQAIDTFESDWVLSVHGMAAEGVSLSNGTSGPAAPESPVGRLYSAFSLAHPEAYITTCNEGAGAVVDQRLCGSTNTQGRYVNGSEDVCTQGAPQASGRFVHLEQSKAFRADSDSVGEALISAWDSAP